MNFATIKPSDIANGPGVRVSLFVSGCTNHCENCFQPETWDFDYGEPFDEKTADEILSLLGRPYIKGLTVLGGEPFEPSNQRALLPFLSMVRERYPDKSIWIYSGFTFEELMRDGSHPHCAETLPLLRLVDVLVDGRFVEKLKNLSLRFRGSSNQRLIDMKKTLRDGKVVLWE